MSEFKLELKALRGFEGLWLEVFGDAPDWVEVTMAPCTVMGLSMGGVPFFVFYEPYEFLKGEMFQMSLDTKMVGDGEESAIEEWRRKAGLYDKMVRMMT